MAEDMEALGRAFAKLEEIRPYFCCIELGSDYEYVWDIRFVRALFTEQGYVESGHKKQAACPHSHTTLAEAIEHFYAGWKNNALLREP